jgi:hypothetical protein
VKQAFHRACIGGRPECAEALVRAGCDVGIEDGDGETGEQVRVRPQRRFQKKRRRFS